MNRCSFCVALTKRQDQKQLKEEFIFATVPEDRMFTVPIGRDVRNGGKGMATEAGS